MKITIEGASPEFERKLLDLLAEHRRELTVAVDTEWNADRAARYLRTLPSSARSFLEEVVKGKGYADAAALRDLFGSLRGPTIALSRAIPRGVKAGWWPEGIAAPVQAVYDPANPSWQRAIGYSMDKAVLAVFVDALWDVFGYGPGDLREHMDPEQLAEVLVREDAEALRREEKRKAANWADADAPQIDLEARWGRPSATGWADTDDVPRALDILDGDDQ
ncbi:hypothetical protein ACIPK5_30850 [Streptomyces sp. NPDC086843]|uniref:hypothetical protein n=1 Tax=Streptomyces sp. NPDC086843 TaxID=3365763 RepID=UPI0038271C0B